MGIKSSLLSMSTDIAVKTVGSEGPSNPLSPFKYPLHMTDFSVLSRTVHVGPSQIYWSVAEYIIRTEDLSELFILLILH